MRTSCFSAGSRRLSVLLGVWAVLGGGALLVPACYGRNCEGGTFQYGLDGGQGSMVDENTWESTAPNAEWLFFPRQHSYVFTMPLGGRTPVNVIPSVSGQPGPNRSNSTIGSGNLTETANWGPNQVTVINDTCSDYYLRLFVQAPPFPSRAVDSETPSAPDASSSAGELDAGTSGDAGDAGDTRPL